MSGDQFIIVDLSVEFVRVWVDLGDSGMQGEVTLTAVARSRVNDRDYRFTFAEAGSDWFELSSGVIPEGWHDSVKCAFEKYNPEREQVKELGFV